ncbi:NfeD family protein [Roseovarius sp. 2305UL8-3]|uniref:NfeD family protein n=1 Tax=Roseovarius conchicola TaxID=3121636 RepID=UPI003527C9E6
MAGVALWSLWWVWLAAALGLAILEVAVPGFVFLGFAIGAAVTALVVLLPIELGLTALLAIFAILSLIAWIVLRRLFKTPDDQTRVIREDINK